MIITSPTARAPLENSDWMLVLQQKAETIADFGANARLDMDDRAETLIRSLKRGTEYSEVFVKARDRGGRSARARSLLGDDLLLRSRHLYDRGHIDAIRIVAGRTTWSRISSTGPLANLQPAAVPARELFRSSRPRAAATSCHRWDCRSRCSCSLRAGTLAAFTSSPICGISKRRAAPRLFGRTSRALPRLRRCDAARMPRFLRRLAADLDNHPAREAKRD